VEIDKGFSIPREKTDIRVRKILKETYEIPGRRNDSGNAFGNFKPVSLVFSHHESPSIRGGKDVIGFVVKNTVHIVTSFIIAYVSGSGNEFLVRSERLELSKIEIQVGESY
jgi:hypothetical protein